MRQIDSKDSKKVIIFGTGGNCADILDMINDINSLCGRERYSCIGFLDDERSKWSKDVYGVKVLGPIDSARDYPDSFFVNGIGSPNNFWKKEAIIARAGVPPERFVTIVHPSASVSKMAKLGLGTVVFQNATITSNVRVGNHVIILPNSVISHDDVIGDFVCIAGGVAISGNVKVGNSTYIGTGSMIIGNIKIGDCCLVGMGSVVLRDVEPNSVVVGNPAKYLRQTVPAAKSGANILEKSKG